MQVFAGLPSVPQPEPGQRILVFTPHPDDETIAVGGYIYTASKAGALVRIVLVTDGNKHGLKIKRYREFREAARCLNLHNSDNLVFWGFPDGHLAEKVNDLLTRVRQEIANYQPDIIIYPHHLDQHRDHAVLGEVVEKVMTDPPEQVRARCYCYLVHYRYFPEPAILEGNNLLVPPAALAQEDWQCYWLYPEAVAAKREALLKYKTQLHNPFIRPLLGRFLRQNELLLERFPYGQNERNDRPVV